MPKLTNKSYQSRTDGRTDIRTDGPTLIIEKLRFKKICKMKYLIFISSVASKNYHREKKDQIENLIILFLINRLYN